MSVTEVYGEFAPGDYESFRETIIKVPVRYSDARLILPAVVWVSSERSVVRGAGLGFNKHFCAQEAWSGTSFKSETGASADLDQCSFELTEFEELPAERKQSLLLSPELVVPTLSLEAAGPSRLTVEDSRHTDPSRIARDVNQWSGMVLGHEIVAQAIWEVAGEFI